MALVGQVVDGREDQVATSGMQRALGEEDVVMDVESREILADHGHHRIDCRVLDDRHPLVFRHGAQLGAILICQRLADRNEIIARIETRRDFANLVAQRFAVPQVDGFREHVDLRPGIVDVIFLGDLMAGKGEQVGQRVAHNGATAMADMHGTGRVGGDIFDVDLAALAQIRAAEILAG